jgi:hypothetical protein
VSDDFSYQLLDKDGGLRLQAYDLINKVVAFHGQPIYENIETAIAEKRWLFRIVFPVVRVLSRSRLANMAMLWIILAAYSAFRHPERGCSIFQYGQSYNNIVSLERLNACLPQAVRKKVSLNGRPVSLRDRFSVIFALRTVWQGAGALQQLRHDRALPHLQAVIAIAALLFYRRFPLSKTVRVLCTASDHSPVCQALLFLAASSGRKTCYIQHAPVTEYFPPLAYDLAVLSDNASASAYREAACRAGVTFSTRVVYLSPFEREFEPPRLGLPPYVVGICLSFLPDVERLTALICDVLARPSVKEVILRKHPRCPLELSQLLRNARVSLQSDGETADAFFDNVDVVLVPNSGVTIEALHRGRPTFFTAGMDKVPDDYYGFVENNILPKFKAELLDNREALLAFFDADWQTRFGEYDDTVYKTPSAARIMTSAAFQQLI